MDICDRSPIIASLVAETARLDFLPCYLGPHLMVRAEALVYAWMNQLSQNYKGGYWYYYTLSNGGFYLSPAHEGPMCITVESNWFDGILSADSAGIIATMFALSQITSEVEARGLDVDSLIDHYHHLREFAAEHIEREAIFRALE